MKTIKKIISTVLILGLLLPTFVVPFDIDAFADAMPYVFSDTISAEAGATVTVNVDIANNTGVAGATLTLSYDEKLTLKEAANGEAFSALSMTPPGTFSNPCNFLWDAEKITADQIKDGTVLVLTFDVADTVQPGEQLDIAVSYKQGAIIDSDLNALTPDFSFSVESEDDGSPKLVVDKKIARAEDQVSINISLINNPGVSSIALKVTYPEGITLSSLSYNEGLGGTGVVPRKKTSPVSLQWDNYDADSTGDVVLATLIFDVDAETVNGVYQITLSYDAGDIFNYKEEQLDFRIVNGNIKVSEGDILDSGSCGEHAIYTFNKEGVLEIGGYGAVSYGELDEEMNEPKHIPWENYRDEIKELIVDEGITAISVWWLPELTKATLPESLESIDDCAFIRCNKLSEVNIPNNVTYIGRAAFLDTSIEKVFIPAKVNSINFNSFAGCNNISQLSVDSKNTVYDSRENCNAIIETATDRLIQGSNGTVIPEGIKSIGPSAFYHFHELACLFIPESVETIETDAFSWMDALQFLVFNGDAPQIDTLAFFNNDKLKIYYPEGNSTWDQLLNKDFYDCEITWISYNTKAIASITTARVNISSDLKMKVFADIAGEGDVRLRATDLVTNAVTIRNGSGKEGFAFPVIPTCISHNYMLEMIDEDGNVLDKVDSYGIQDYCEHLAENTSYSSDQKMMTLLADILNYGAAAQIYKNDRTDNLPNTAAWVAPNQSAFSVPVSDLEVNGDGDGAYISKASLQLSDVVNVNFTIVAPNTDKLTAKLIRISDAGEKTVGMYTIDHDEFKITTDDIYATQFGDKYRLELYRENVEIMNATYSVASYINRFCNDITVGGICKALWNYGKSAYAFAH